MAVVIEGGLELLVIVAMNMAIFMVAGVSDGGAQAGVQTLIQKQRHRHN